MSTIKIPKSLSVKEASYFIERQRKIDEEDKKFANKYTKYYHIYNGFVLLYIHMLIFNILHHWIYGTFEEMIVFMIILSVMLFIFIKNITREIKTDYLFTAMLIGIATLLFVGLMVFQFYLDVIA